MQYICLHFPLTLSLSIPPFPSFSLQTMSVADFATMLAYLVRVCWSAAAGQLHLASIGDSHPPSPSQFHPAKEKAHTEENSVPPTQLRAGLCLHQETGSVSSKVQQREGNISVSSQPVECVLVMTYMSLTRETFWN